MILSSPIWASQLTTTELRSVVRQQKRFRTFVRRVDKNNELYFTIAQRGPAQNPEPTSQLHEFFEISDLLLDLDAEGTREVRASNEADEEQMTARWDVNPRRTAVRARIQELKEQVWESRRKVDAVFSNPTNIWRLSPHDILSAALHGGARLSRETEQVGRKPLTTEDMGEVKLRKVSGLTEVLQRENGIPPHALQEDQLLLEWMLLRSKGLRQFRKSQGEEPLSAAQLSKSLKEQSSITGIRRLVSQALTSAAHDPTYIQQIGLGKDSLTTPNIPRDIREACLRVLSQEDNDPITQDEILTFLGNLSDRVSKRDGSIGGTLYGLALRLSAESQITQAIVEWLHRGHSHGVWVKDAKTPEDISAVLATLVKYLGNTGPGAHQSAEERQLIFQLLTGIDESNLLSSNSFRAFTRFYIGEKSRIQYEQAFSIYESYITLLGQLGAVRTLWKESRTSAPLAENQLKKHNVTGNVGKLMEAALTTAIQVASPPPTDVAPDIGLDECVTLDYHSIDLQNPESRLSKDNSAITNTPSGSLRKTKNLVSSLHLPLNEWLSKVGEAIQSKVNSGV